MTKCTIEGCAREHRAKGLCTTHLYRLKKGIPLTGKTVYDKTPLERFSERYDVMPSGCWHWDSNDGKGRATKFRLNGNSMYASRAAYVLHKGPIGDLHVCHTCDNGLCVNPDHLFLGTHLDNMRDMIDKGRKPKGRDTNTLFGSTHPCAVLSEADVLAIRASEKSITELASHYGVHYGTIYAIIQRRNWKHI